MYHRQRLPKQTILLAGKMQRPLSGNSPLCQQCRLHSSQHTSTQNNVLHLHTRVHRKRRWALWENQWVKCSNPGFFIGEISKFIFLYFHQSYLNLLVVNQMKSVQGMRLATLGIVSIPVWLQIHVAQAQLVLWRITEPNASVHLALLGILSEDVFKVSQQREHLLLGSWPLDKLIFSFFQSQNWGMSTWWRVSQWQGLHWELL